MSHLIAQMHSSSRSECKKLSLIIPVVREASFPYLESSRIRFSSILSNERCKTRLGSLLVNVGENVGVGWRNGSVGFWLMLGLPCN